MGSRIDCPGALGTSRRTLDCSAFASSAAAGRRRTVHQAGEDARQHDPVLPGQAVAAPARPGTARARSLRLHSGQAHPGGQRLRQVGLAPIPAASKESMSYCSNAARGALPQHQGRPAQGVLGGRVQVQGGRPEPVLGGEAGSAGNQAAGLLARS